MLIQDNCSCTNYVNNYTLIINIITIHNVVLSRPCADQSNEEDQEWLVRLGCHQIPHRYSKVEEMMPS